jgi:hypothetical protein
MRKILFIVAAAVILISIGIYLYLRYRKLEDFEPLLKAKLSELVQQGSDSLYRLEVDNIDADILQSKVTITGVRLVPDSTLMLRLDKEKKLPNDLYYIHLNTLFIQDIDIHDITSGNIGLSNVVMQQPQIEIVHYARDYNKQKLPQPSDTLSFYEKIAKAAKRIEVNRIKVNDGDFQYTNALTQRETRVHHIDFLFQNILIDSSTQIDSTRFLFAQYATISFQNFSMITTDSMYRISLQQCNINAAINEMNIKGFEVKPLLTKVAFGKKLGYRKDRFEARVDSIFFKEANWWAFATDEEIGSQKITLHGGEFHVFSNKALPARKSTKNKKIPHQSLMALAIPVNIDTLSIKDLDVYYEEFSTQSYDTGIVKFMNANAIATHISNQPEVIQKFPLLTVEADASFMNLSPLHAEFNFNLSKHEEGIFTVKASLGSLNAVHLNAITQPLGLVKINKGTVQSLQLTMNGNNYRSTGKMTLKYKDLNVTVLKSATKSEGENLDKQGFVSFLANTFFLKKDNPYEGEKVRTVNTYFVRNPKEKGFWALVWKNILDGVLKTVGMKKEK